MDQLTIHRDDIYAWSREQASVLREMSNRRDLPNALDLENVAEEIEGVGSEVRNAVESFLRLILLHLAKVALSPTERAKAHWREEIAGFHAELQGRYTRSMSKDIDLDLLWRRALRQARYALERHGEEAPANPPASCPLLLTAFIGEELDFDDCLRKVQTALVPTGPDQQV